MQRNKTQKVESLVNKFTDGFKEYPYLKQLFWLYILLATTDTVHHLHAATALGQSNALHAFWTGILLIPLAILLVLRFLYSKNRYLLWCFFAIVGLATLIPGLFHGGWHHVIKLLTATNRDSLIPANNPHLLFYEISGSIEFFLAVLSAFFLYKCLSK